ncbi:MAG: lysophospholipid acyltransferase family protein [Synergistaceae bacterium]|nr:lysophospholipid acyltransferase family protein [Synergistaceae bacterium]
MNFRKDRGKKIKIKKNFSAKLLKLFIALIKKLPYGLAVKLGSFLGVALWFFSFRRVNRLEARCVSSLGVGVTLARKIIRGSYANMGRICGEFFNLKSRGEAAGLVTISGEEYLREALEAGRGVIIMAAHLANWEIAAAAVCHSGYPLNVIYTPQRNTAGIEDIYREQREKICGMGLIKSEGAGMKEALKVLKRGEILCILQDLDARADGEISEFLGLPASVHTGLIKLSRRFDCPVIPGRAARDEKGKNYLLFYPPLTSFGGDMEKSLSICNNIIESWVREHPEQWMWILDRWEYASNAVRHRPGKQ